MISVEYSKEDIENAEKKDGDNSIIEGILTCCNAHDFEVFVVGEIKHSMFSKMCLFPENDKTVIEGLNKEHSCNSEIMPIE